MAGYFIVGALGALVGATELVSRYRDEPLRAIFSLPAAVYVVVNMLAALAALYLIDIFHWRFGLDESAEPGAVRTTQILVGGLSAMALFRSALFTVRVGEGDVGIGPTGILQVLLDAADRGVDRGRATPRAEKVTAITTGVSFEKAHEVLPATCFALMQNLSPAVQEAVGNEIKALANAAMNDQAKAILLGLSLMNVVGPEVLQSAVRALGDQIRA